MTSNAVFKTRISNAPHSLVGSISWDAIWELADMFQIANHSPNVTSMFSPDLNANITTASARLRNHDLDRLILDA